MERRVKNIIDGFDIDFDRMVSEFPKKSPTFRLQEFFEFWKDKKFDCIFANRVDPRELLESIKELNFFLVSLLEQKIESPDCTDATVIVTLYFLLCLYSKQPERFKTKIRMTIPTAIRIDKFVHDYKTRNAEDFSKDVDYVWKKLRAIRSIEFVEELQIYGPSMIASRNAGSNVTKPTTSTGARSLRQDSKKTTSSFLRNDFKMTFDKLDQLSEMYNTTKEKLDLDSYHYDIIDETEKVEQVKVPLKDCLSQIKSLVDNYLEEENC